MKKVFFVILLCVLCFSKSYSQPISTQKEIVDERANEILKKVAAKLKSYSSLELELIVTPDTKQEKASSNLKASLLMQGAKYRLIMEEQIIYCNGKQLWFYLPETKEVQLHKVDSTSGDVINLTKLLLNYNKNYKARFIREDRENNVSIQIIDLHPRKASQDYTKIRLYLNKANLQVTQIDMQQVSGIMSAYKVLSYKPNATVSASDFEFNTVGHPDVELIDMR